MAFLGKARKEDLRVLVFELGLEVPDNPKVIDLKELIVKSKGYDEDLAKNMLSVIIDQRIKSEQIAEDEKKKLKEAQEQENARLEIERNFQLEKLKLEIESKKVSQTANPSHASEQTKLELSRIIPKFNSEEDEIGLYLTLFERQIKFLNIPKHTWVAYLIGSLPSEVARLIAKEDEKEVQDYDKVKKMLLKRFRVTADKFRQLFSQHKKSSDMTYRDFYFELISYFEGWIEGLNVTSFDELKSLIIADQMKKRTPPDIKEHFIDSWADLNNPLELAQKLDTYESVRNGWKRNVMQTHKKSFINENKVSKDAKSQYSQHSLSENPSRSRRVLEVPSQSRRDSTYFDREKKTTIFCYGCGTPGVIRTKCQTCNVNAKKEKNPTPTLNNLNFYSFSMKDHPSSIIETSVCDTQVAVCADTGATHSVAGEKLYHLLRNNGCTFENKVVDMTLADGLAQEVEILTTLVNIGVQGKTIPTELIVLKNAKGNRTLLGADFLSAAGIVLDLQQNKWYFSENPRVKYNFVETPPNINALLAVPAKETHLQLRDNEGTHLSSKQRKELSSLLEKYERSFKPGGDPTPFVEHRINTVNNHPIAVPPYRMSPAKREILKTEIDKLLAQGVIEECESPYASPVVLVPKPNGKIRLCVDYRKLNNVTIPDNYPLPRMDDLLNEATPTAYMTTIDLQSGYHQVKVEESDQDKTAFICPFGTYRYLRMPYGLRNAPATFQRLIDKFRSGLKDVFALSYLDDIIILSETFDKHLKDLETVFNRLLVYKLHPNREKCHFACDRVKYLGFWITKDGIEADPDKIASIQRIPVPTNVKEIQSLLQTCSWFRRYVPNFAEIARPLSNLTKKRVNWHWGPEQQEAFEILKERLTSPPVLKQPDGSKPFIVRTDASNYALGAVLLQGNGPDEHVIEYASRLLLPAEQNYSATEREALAVVWALEKFRGYIENQEITIASDHQPLKWLLSIKSPSGRLARWALKIQSFNLKIEYIPGKCNVVADLLSRPTYTQENIKCDMKVISINFPARKSSDIRSAQLADAELKKIIESFENNDKDENFANYTSRGYLMNQGILYRYSPETESEEAQLVVPIQERERILQEYHDAPSAGHYGIEGTFKRIASRYYFPGMRKYVSEYIKTCSECNRYKSANQKPAGLLRTPIYAQRSEVLAIDLFGPLPETPSGKRWIFLVEDTSTKWVELFALDEATAANCAKVLIEEVFLRYGLPRRLISDNGAQFVSAVMQQTCSLLGIAQDLIPVYHPQANPSERKNRDLKPRLAMLVAEDHTAWEEKLPLIRFSMNTATCDTTGHTAAYLQFGRELRTTDDVVHDIREVIDNDNFIPQITPYLKKFAHLTKEIRDRVEQKQDQRKRNFDRRRRRVTFNPGDKVWVTIHPISKNHRTKKFLPKREGPYVIRTLRSPTTYEITDPSNPDQVLGTYHVSALKAYIEPDSKKDTGPVVPIRKRGRPRKKVLASSP